ncbi:MAG TPA: transketolase, partial [Alphaproteobacteria bacterium]|nr:transketolase [Alphaproteobacteria bacterium]
MPDDVLKPSDLRAMANAIRIFTIDAVDKAKSGHQGMPMGMADVATVLYTRFLKFDAAAPDWPDRDRVVLSAGHGSMLLYSLLYFTGSPDMSVEEIKRFRQWGSKTPGHPEYGHTKGVETTTGPLGQGFGNAVGMAIAEAHLNGVFGSELVDHTTYVFASDGDLMEGISHEAAALAGHLKLRKLIVLFDDNGITIDGKLSLTDSVDQVKRFDAYGWNTMRVDGHDVEAIAKAIDAARASDRPTLIACKTIIGFGAPKSQGTHGAHGTAITGDEIKATREALGWTLPAFEMPDDLLSKWRAAGARGRATREAWTQRLSVSESRAEFERRIKGALPQTVLPALKAHIKAMAEKPTPMATRKASGLALDVIAEHMPDAIGGSADLSGSNNTKAKSQNVLNASDYSGRYIHYGVREHAMAAAMNGMALHGGVYPYSGTFMVFSDYCRPAIRLAALMGLKTVFVMTHDSIGVGEDGPTHQPIEQLAALRAMPNLTVFRPADAVETAECWELALQNTEGPSLMALTRQDLPPVRTSPAAENRCAYGGYVLSQGQGRIRLVLIA